MIAAISEDYVIGSADGSIPWSLPRDQQHFRTYTSGKWMLLGRKTYEEMDGWFTTHTPIVLTRNADYSPASNHHVAHSVDDAIAMARSLGAPELVVSGGAELFAAALPLADRLLITRIEGKFPVKNPVYFPKFENSGDWKIESSERWPRDSKNAQSMAFEIWNKQVLAGQ